MSIEYSDNKQEYVVWEKMYNGDKTIFSSIDNNDKKTEESFYVYKENKDPKYYTSIEFKEETYDEVTFKTGVLALENKLCDEELYYSVRHCDKSLVVEYRNFKAVIRNFGIPSITHISHRKLNKKLFMIRYREDTIIVLCDSDGIYIIHDDCM